MELPETRYVNSGGVHLAYQVIGDGPIDLLVVAEAFSHCELRWEEPSLARSLRRLASFSRLIMFDKRGTGLSDPVPATALPTLEQRLEDLEAILDAVGSRRAAVMGASEGGAESMMFAATRPERVSSLVLYAAWPRFFVGDGYPIGRLPESLTPLLQGVLERWGRGDLLALIAPSIADDPRVRTWSGQFERLSASPGTAAALMSIALENDVRGILSSIRVPTLVIHRTGDVFAPVEHGRYLASHIPGARYVELPGSDHPHFFGDTDAVVAAVQEFLTGTPVAADRERVLATVLFTDVVGSTERAAALGDRRWRDLLEAHNLAVRRQLRAHDGTEVDTAGDGFLATFSGPARAVRCALAIRDSVVPLGLQIRAGVHTGEVQLRSDGIGGIAVHIGARVAGQAGAGDVVVSRTVKDLVAGSGLHFHDIGERELKGVPDRWQLYTASE
jgi:pimeloyl-ACP methyl ester carboxylesterase